MQKIKVDLKIKALCFKIGIKGLITISNALNMPGLIRLQVIGEKNDMLEFKLLLPEAGAADVVEREVSVKVGDAEANVQVVEGGTVELGGFTGEQDAPVQVSLVDVDDVGNRSEARVQDFVLVDNLAPPQPGEIALQVTNEF